MRKIIVIASCRKMARESSALYLILDLWILWIASASPRNDDSVVWILRLKPQNDDFYLVIASRFIGVAIYFRFFGLQASLRMTADSGFFG